VSADWCPVRQRSLISALATSILDHRCLDYLKAGMFTLNREGSFSGSLQIQVGRQTSIMVSTADGTVRLSNSEPMKP
jgi:hypothetical protein